MCKYEFGDFMTDKAFGRILGSLFIVPWAFIMLFLVLAHFGILI